MFRLVKVHDNVHLIDKCVSLLNDEWPREKTTRLRSLQSSSNTYPLCLALVDDNENVIGFVKLRSELPFNQAIFLESLVVDKGCRSKGLGRFIMNECCKLVKESGFDRITLTTEDKEGFYLKMGFCRVHDKPPDRPNGQTQPPPPMHQSSQSILPPPPPVPKLFRKVDTKTKILMYKDL